MTSTSGLSTSKPNRRAKALALALLPMALAITACTGGSSDSGTGSGTGNGYTRAQVDQARKDGDAAGYTRGLADGKASAPGAPSPYAGYADDIKVLEDLAKSDSTTPVFQKIKDKAWMLNVLGSSSQTPEIKNLATAFNNIVKITGGNNVDLGTDVGLNGKQIKEYLELIKKVEMRIESDYKTAIKGPLKNLQAYNLPDSAFSTTAQSFSFVSSDSADNDNREFDLLSEVETKYSESTEATKEEWGKADLRNLKPGSGGLHNLIGWRNNPAAQLSFYHATPAATGAGKGYSVGVDFAHMNHVSLFLYYYADTDGKLKNTPSLNRNEFMASLKKDAVLGQPNWTVSGIVDGQGDVGDFTTLVNATYVGKAENLTYNGIMMAGTLGSSLETYMGDAKVVLKFNSAGDSVDALDFTFSNIASTNDYLMGMTSSNMIKIMDIGNTEFQQFDNSTTADADHDGNIIKARFFGDGEGALSRADHYNGRDAIGGTFTARLTDDEGNVKDMKSKQYYGVFGAVAE